MGGGVDNEIEYKYKYQEIKKENSTGQPGAAAPPPKKKKTKKVLTPAVSFTANEEQVFKVSTPTKKTTFEGNSSANELLVTQPTQASMTSQTTSDVPTDSDSSKPKKTKKKHPPVQSEPTTTSMEPKKDNVLENTNVDAVPAAFKPSPPPKPRKLKKTKLQTNAFNDVNRLFIPPTQSIFPLYPSTHSCSLCITRNFNICIFLSSKKERTNRKKDKEKKEKKTRKKKNKKRKQEKKKKKLKYG